MTLPTKNIVICLLAACTAACIYLNKDRISEEIECALSDPKKEEVLRKLQRVRKALCEFVAELERVEKECKKSTLAGEKIDPAIKRVIPGLSVDLDYIFDTLDAIVGDASVKTKRKKLVDEFKALAQRVDDLTVHLR